MKFLMIITLLILFHSCALFKGGTIGSNKYEEIKSICLNADGKGRIEINSQKHVFSFFSELYQEKNQWLLGLDFPLRSPDELIIEWSEAGESQLKSNLVANLLKNSKNVSPQEIEKFIQYVGGFVSEVALIKSGKVEKSNYEWKVSKKSLNITHGSFTGEFKNKTAQNYFGLMTFSYIDSEQRNYKMDLVVRNCLKKSGIESNI